VLSKAGVGIVLIFLALVLLLIAFYFIGFAALSLDISSSHIDERREDKQVSEPSTGGRCASIRDCIQWQPSGRSEWFLVEKVNHKSEKPKRKEEGMAYRRRERRGT